MSNDNNLEKLSWQKMVAPYTKAESWRSLWQIANTLIPYFVLWGLMFWSVNISYWLTLLLAIPTAGFMIRSFIIFHDCGHGSFFNSRRGNEILGVFLGILNFTAFYAWRHDHARHHASAGNLDKRGVGDVMTLTVQEYREAPWWKRLAYRISRQPLVIFTVGATIVFAFAHRFPRPGSGRQERFSVYFTNLGVLAFALALIYFFGLKAYLVVQLPILVLACSAGVWLFYVQHQFESVYWERQEKWSFVRAALQGSSFYQLPGILQWFTGNIGFHHIHHLSPRIPNYFLPRCHKANPALQIKPLTLLSSLKCARLRLWDEANRRLVGFKAVKNYG